MLQEYWASTVIFIGIFSQCNIHMLYGFLAPPQSRVYFFSLSKFLNLA